MSNIPYKCRCGGGTFVVRGDAEPKTYDEMIGSTCEACGREVTDAEFKEFALKIAEEAIKKALR